MKTSIRHFINLVESEGRDTTALTEARKQPVLMFHGTPVGNLRGILKQGLLPSEAGAEVNDRWATLGGVYLTSDLGYAIRAGREVAQGDTPAIVIASISPKSGTPDEDVVEKAVEKAFASALDTFGVDDAYDGDIEQYARHEEERPREWEDDEPFDREQFFRDFWTVVQENMDRIAGKPHRPDLALLQSAIDCVLTLADTRNRFYNDDEKRRFMERWRGLKARLIAVYPALRTLEQHTQADLSIPHNVRLTRPLGFSGRNRIVCIVAPTDGGWRVAYGTLPDGVAAKFPAGSV